LWPQAIQASASHISRADAGSINKWVRPGETTLGSFGFLEIAGKLRGEQPNHTLELTCIVSGMVNRAALLAFDIKDAMGNPLMQAVPSVEPCVKLTHDTATLRVEIKLPALVPGQYWVTAWAGPHFTGTFNLCVDCISFEVSVLPMPGRMFP
jgi:lipopolysaccharide transport system ATP-binding protein